MRLRILCLLALCFALLCGCTEAETSAPLPDLSPVTNAVAEFNSADPRYTAFTLNVSEAGKGKEESLFFTQGTASYRKGAPVAMSGRMTQIQKGVGSSANMYYKAGAYYRDSGESKYYLIMDRDAFLKQFICTDVLLFAEGEVTSAHTATTGAGTKYTLSLGADTAALNGIFGDTLFNNCGLRKARRDKVVYDKVQYTYVVSTEGKLVSFAVNASATLYDTPAYYPNYSVDEESLKHSFDISFELTVKATGNSVVIEVPKTEDFVFIE